VTSEELRERLIAKAGVPPGDAGAMAAVLHEAAEPVRRVLHEVEHQKRMVDIYRKEAMFAAKAAFAAVIVAGLVAMFAFFGWLAGVSEWRGAERTAERATVDRMARTLTGIEQRLMAVEAKP
jgi:hypothetical protein